MKLTYRISPYHSCGHCHSRKQCHSRGALCALRESLQCETQPPTQRTVFPLCPRRLGGGNLFNVKHNPSTNERCLLCVPSDSLVSPPTRRCHSRLRCHSRGALCALRESLQCETQPSTNERCFPFVPADSLVSPSDPLVNKGKKNHILF